jgi:hypothetical protein
MAMHAGTLNILGPTSDPLQLYVLRYHPGYAGGGLVHLNIPPVSVRKACHSTTEKVMSFHNNSSLSHLPFLPAESESVQGMDLSDGTLDCEVVSSVAGMDSSQTLSHQRKHFPPWETIEQTPSQFKKPRSDVHVNR